MAVILVLFCFGYFAMAYIPFLFVRLDIPDVWRLFRGLFNIYFRVVAVVGVAAAAAFASSGLIAITAEMLLLAVGAIVLRSMVLDRMDSEQIAGRAGDVAAVLLLRRIHWGAMLVNVAILASVAGSVPFIL